MVKWVGWVGGVRHGGEQYVVTSHLGGTHLSPQLPSPFWSSSAVLIKRPVCVVECGVVTVVVAVMAAQGAWRRRWMRGVNYTQH